MNHIMLNNKIFQENNKNAMFTNGNTNTNNLKRQRSTDSNETTTCQSTGAILQSAESTITIEGDSTDDSDGDGKIGDLLRKKHRINGVLDFNLHTNIFESEKKHENIKGEEICVEEEQIDQREDAVSRELTDLVKERFGKLQKNIKVMTEEAPFYVKCCFKHIWSSTLKQIRCRWCPKCETFLEKARKHAENQNGELLSRFYGPTLEFRCAAGHTWTEETKHGSKKWCSTCKKNVREEKKQKERWEEEKRTQELSEKQNYLFEEAKRNYISEEYKSCRSGSEKRESSQSSQCGGSQPSNSKISTAFNFMESEIDTLVRKNLAANGENSSISSKQGEEDSFCNDEVEKQRRIRDFINVRKVLLIPDDILKLYLASLSKEVLKSEYKSRVKLIHPDKNSDPNSGVAFVKLNSIYEVVLRNFA